MLDTVLTSSSNIVFVNVTYSVTAKVSHSVVPTITVLDVLVTFTSIVMGTVIGFGTTVVAVVLPYVVQTTVVVSEKLIRVRFTVIVDTSYVVLCAVVNGTTVVDVTVAKTSELRVTSILIVDVLTVNANLVTVVVVVVVSCAKAAPSSIPSTRYKSTRICCVYVSLASPFMENGSLIFFVFSQIRF